MLSRLRSASPWMVLLTGIALCSSLFADSDEEMSRADDIKGVFIYKFTGYIDWPDDDAETFNIAVLGNSGIVDSLVRISEKRRANNKKLVIEQFQNLEDVADCHILFVSGSESGHLRDIIKKAAKEKILTIGSSEGFARRGVAINFVTVEDRIKFEINGNALESIGLKVSSQLLKLAIPLEEEGRVDGQEEEQGGEQKEG